MNDKTNNSETNRANEEEKIREENFFKSLRIPEIEKDSGELSKQEELSKSPEFLNLEKSLSPEILDLYLHYKPKIERLRPIDDDFACCLFRGDPEFMEKVLRIILKRDIKIERVETQVDIKQPDDSKELIFDVIGYSSDGSKYNIEIQRDNRGATPVRGEAHFIVIGHESLRKGFRVENLPDIHIIFITEGDIQKDGNAVTHIKKVNMNNGEIVNGREHLICFNASYKGDDEWGYLAHDFLCSDPDEMILPFMAEKARYYKKGIEGVRFMCQIWEEVKQEGREEAIVNTIRKIMKYENLTADQAMDSLYIFSPDERKEYLKLI